MGRENRARAGELSFSRKAGELEDHGPESGGMAVGDLVAERNHPVGRCTVDYPWNEVGKIVAPGEPIGLQHPSICQMVFYADQHANRLGAE